jgi:hypothetical protein
MMMAGSNQKLVLFAWAHAFFSTVSGIWPIVHLPSFLGVTGPKVDLWLVRTVGALLAWTGILVGLAAWRNHFSRDLFALVIGQASILALVDVIYVTAGRISPIYLGDAAAELLLVLGWCLLFPRRGQPAGPD